MSEANRKRLMDIKLKDCNNNKCADCGAEDPEWASYSLGVFLCFNCCGVHRSMGTHLSRTKSLTVDNWENEQVTTMDELGNEAAAKKYLLTVPDSYRRPDKDSPMVLREQWIRGKYERNDFQDIERQTFLKENKTGYLMKRGRDDGKFLPRRFVLDGKENVLMYFVKEGSKSPKAKLPIDQLNCCFVPAKIGHPNGMQFSYDDSKGSTRNLFVYSDDGKDIVDWYNAIRHAKYKRLRIGLPHLTEQELVARLTRDFLLEGWLYKTGPDIKDAWRRRWFTLDKRRLLYADDPMSAFAKGEIYLGHKTDDYAVYDGVPPGRQNYGISFTLRSPGRQYPLSAEIYDEKELWVSALKHIISIPLTAQEAAQMHAWRAQH